MINICSANYLGVERNRNQETGSFQELLELVISGKCMHSRYPHKTPGIKNSCKITRSCSTPMMMTEAVTKITIICRKPVRSMSAKYQRPGHERLLGGGGQKRPKSNYHCEQSLLSWTVIGRRRAKKA